MDIITFENLNLKKTPGYKSKVGNLSCLRFVYDIYLLNF